MSVIGWTEIFIIALFVLLFVGPKHMPAMIKKLGRLMGELRVASRELRNQISTEVGDIQSPTDIVRSVEQNIKDELFSPYDDVISENREKDYEVDEDANSTEELSDSDQEKDSP